ncbi:MAG: GntR family transcriptional regulator [Gemmatimonadaceae bacterium]
MHILVNPSADLPIYRQIMRQIMDAIAGGQLASNDRLPSHRELSEQLVIAPLTVKKAYDELEALGYIDSQRGRGTFVSGKLPKVSQAVVNAQMQSAARALLSQAYLAGLRFSEVIALMKHVDRDLTDSPAPPRRKESR